MIEQEKTLLEKIKFAKKILITAHTNPDADSVGSTLSMYKLVKNLNVKCDVEILLQDKVPNNLKFLDDNKVISNIIKSWNHYNFDLAIVVDSGEIGRIGKVMDIISEDCYIINIDHHISNTNFGSLNIVKEDRAATVEIIFEIFKSNDIKIDKKIASYLYAGLVGDTGNFLYRCVTSKTLNMGSDLLSYDIDNEKIARKVNVERNYKSLKLLGYALLNMKYIEEKNFLYSFIPKEILQQEDASKEDTEGIIEVLNSYKDSEIVLFLKEDDHRRIKGSIRSKGTDVSKIANFFGGGGHKQASGFSTKKKLSKIIKEICEQI